MGFGILRAAVGSRRRKAEECPQEPSKGGRVRCRAEGKRGPASTAQEVIKRGAVLALSTEAAATPDVEEPTKLQQCFRADATHGMCNSYMPDHSDAPLVEDDLDRVFDTFYLEKVRAIQEKAGNSHHLPISGNIYMYRSIAEFGHSSNLFQDKASFLDWLGIVITMIVQIIGPAILLWWGVRQLRISSHIIGFNPWFRTYRQQEHFVSFIGQKVLGLMFLVLFTINGLYTLKSDKSETKKMVHMLKVFENAARKHKNYQRPSETWLWVGAAVNVWCLILCSVSMTLMFVMAENDKGPKDIIFDAFAITFLYNLDDPDGQLSFLEEKWDEDLMGDIYGMMADTLDSHIKAISAERKGHCSPDNIYQVGQLLQWVLMFALPLVFVCVEWKVP